MKGVVGETVCHSLVWKDDVVTCCDVASQLGPLTPTLSPKHFAGNYREMAAVFLGEMPGERELKRFALK